MAINEIMRATESEHGKNGNMEGKRLEKVDLSGLSLKSLPTPSVSLAMISYLDLSNNDLQTLPESLTAMLVNVVFLDLHSNQLTSLPNSVGCLSKLRVLNVSGNMIQNLPRTIEQCRSLEELNVNFNKLTMLPETIGFELTNLKKLSINSNKLVSLPLSTSHLTSLIVLDVRLNRLCCLPEGLENLIRLQVLNLSQNFHHLTTLPDSIGLLPSLRELDISYNKIKILPSSIGCLPNLQKVCVDGNPMISPPMEVFEIGLTAVKNYLCEKMNGTSTPKKRSWVKKLVKYGTFHGIISHTIKEDKDTLLMPEYRSIDGLATPRHIGMLSPRRLFSPRNYYK